MTTNDVHGTWMSIGAAAESAGVARRSAFRWTGQGLVQVRLAGRRRLVEVSSLAALSRIRGRSAMAAQISATAPEYPRFAPSSMDGVVLAALQEAVLALEEAAALHEERLAEIERLLGIGG